MILEGVEALKQEKLDDAQALFQKAVEQSPELPDGYYYLGVTGPQRRRGARDGGLSEGTGDQAGLRAGAVEPGPALLAAERSARALEEFHQAVMSDPDLAEAHYNLGLALAQTGRLDEAAARVQRGYQPGSQIHRCAHTIGIGP